MATKSLRGGERDVRVAKIAGVSFESVRRALDAALTDKYPTEEGKHSPCPWIRDVFDDVVVYEFDGGLFRTPYAFDGQIATLSGEPEAVMVAYVPVGQAPAPGAPAPTASGDTKFEKHLTGADNAIRALQKLATPRRAW